MSAIVLPSRSRFAKAARGWPSSPNEKPSPTIKVKPGKGIFFAALMTDLADPPTDHVQRITATKTSTPVMTVNDHGIAAEIVGANKNYIFPKALNNKPSELTLLTRFKIVSTPTANGGIAVFSYSNNPAQSPYVKVALKHSSTTAFTCYWGGVAVGSAIAFTTGEWYTCVVTTKSGHTEFWVNGISQGSYAGGGGTWGTDPRIIIGEDYGGGRTPGHQTEFLIGFDRFLSDSEIIAYSKDPWGELTEPANQSPFLISVPAGGGATLTVQSATHSHSAESPSLVQAHALTPVDALHIHAAESPSLTQANALNPSDSAHDHSAEQPSLSSASLLAAADALHGHVVDQPSLVQLNIIGPENALHSHSAEQPAITQAHVLAVVSATHAHVAENVTLTVGDILAPDDALHGHLVDAPTLTQAGVLAPADALHAHTAEQPALVQANSLSPDDAAHAHSAEQPTLDLTLVVTPADAAHDHAADQTTLSQAGLLAVADAVHAHLADSPFLSQHITIVASDALHAHLADNATLILGTLETPAGLVYLVHVDRRAYLVN